MVGDSRISEYEQGSKKNKRGHEVDFVDTVLSTSYIYTNDVLVFESRVIIVAASK